MTAESGFPGPGARSWRPAPLLIGLAGAAALGALVLAVLATDPLDRVAAAGIAIVLATVTALGARRRLIGGPRGLLVRGARGSRIIPWSQVRGLDAATSTRAGLTSTTLEIDLVDDDLLVFGRTDLGADPVRVASQLHRWWRP